MILAAVLVSLTASVTAFAAPTVPTQVCTNAGRGEFLVLPEISGGAVAGPLKMGHLLRTLNEIPAASVTNLTVTADGLFAFSGKDTNGNPARVSSTRDTVGRLVVQVWLKDQGMIGFTCPKAK